MAHDPWVIRKAADCAKGQGRACGQLGDEYNVQTYVANSQARAIELFAQGCKLGHAGSCTAAATYVSDDAAALRFAQRGCQLKDDRSCDRVAAAERANNSEPALDRRCRGGEKKACDALAQLQREAYQARVAQCKAAQRNRQLGAPNDSTFAGSTEVSHGTPCRIAASPTTHRQSSSARR